MKSTISAFSFGPYRVGQSALPLLVLGYGLGLAGCAALPESGPRAGQIHDEYQSNAPAHPFELVDVTAKTLEVLENRPNPMLAARFADDQTAPAMLIGPGDGLTVIIWELGSDPLFSSSPAASQQGPSINTGRGSVIPEQIVSSDGCITVPFAGRISVAGHTTVEVQTAIEQALAGKAQKPQVLVNLTHNESNTVTVVGEVANGARFPLSPHGERLLDALATTGGIKTATYETQLQLTRGSETITVPLPEVLRDPKENVYLHPGDSLVITKRPETFLALGATGHDAQLPFDADRVSLTEAVAKAGGLSDSRANPKGVFVLRFEPKSVAENLGPVPAGLADDAPVPVIYQLDFTKAGSFFLAQNFALHDHDILYVSNSSSTELEKFLTLVGLVTTPLFDGAVAESYLRTPQ